MMTKRTTLLAFATGLILAGSLYAHHSYSAYQTDLKVSIEGTITKIDFVNPHVILEIKTRDGEYTAEFPGVTSLSRDNFKAYTLKVGDYVIAKGSPMKDREIKRISLMTELRRPSDGWVWPEAAPKTTP
jgi:hypothetical protein